MSRPLKKYDSSRSSDSHDIVRPAHHEEVTCGVPVYFQIREPRRITKGRGCRLRNTDNKQEPHRTNVGLGPRRTGRARESGSCERGSSGAGTHTTPTVSPCATGAGFFLTG
mmetsp:Transcript_4982/g.10528  ORF Transcript_4982/g.10528 Transcript_4982/m.10528 type:complete len:111 (-) Transcript_4982:35-367(-)